VCVETQVQVNLMLYVPCMMQILTYVTNFFLHWELNTFDTQFPVYRILCVYFSAHAKFVRLVETGAGKQYKKCDNILIVTLTKFWGHGLYKVCSVWRSSPSYAIVKFRKVWRKSELSIHMLGSSCVYTQDSSLPPQSNTLEIGRPQRDRSAAPHYSSTAIVCVVISTRKSSARFLKMILFRFISYYKNA
jgi:hypothetical protein